jgi:glycosyltransferase involved in cell wall biosynthesis
MGFDHAHDFSLVLPVIIEFLRRNPAISFELFGSIPKPPELDEFGERVSVLPPVRNYEAFLRALADRSWDIGICPLVKSEFNLLKANTKWVEYTSVGAAVVASRGTVYDECCSDGCGILAGTPEEWLEALNRLTRSPGKRFEQVAKAQAKLAKEYSVEQLRKQVFQVFDRAKTRSREKERILFIANDYGPTLQLSFIKPLAPILESGELTIDVATVGQMKLNSKVGALTHSKDKWIADRLNNFKPTLLVFSRYNGPSIELIMKWAREARVPVLFHIDDDLLSVPREIGLEKYAYHNEPGKLAALRHLLDNSDLVYASTPRLKERFEALDTKAPIVAGEIYCSGRIIVPASERPVRKIGYMASADHAHNLEMILPAIVQLLRRNPNVKFELFGSIPKLEALEKFGDRIVKTRPVADYETFLEKLAKLEWDIGICPLTRINFNLMKANTKWVEYTSVGTAVIASRGTAYDDCCANGCGILATTPAEWLAAFEKLINDPHERFEQVRRAQARLVQEYSVDRLRAQVLDIFERTRSLVGAKLH